MSDTTQTLHGELQPSKMSREEFIRRFGGLFELSPWVASRAFDAGIDSTEDSIAGLLVALERSLDNASHEEKLALICAHPDLAGKAAIRNELTVESLNEQSSAGLDQCTEDELSRFTQYNDAYRSKFSFPFIMAVRDSNRHEILAAFENRLQHDEQVEFQTALNEIKKIAALRLHELCS